MARPIPITRHFQTARTISMHGHKVGVLGSNIVLRELQYPFLFLSYVARRL